MKNEHILIAAIIVTVISTVVTIIRSLTFTHESLDTLRGPAGCLVAGLLMIASCILCGLIRWYFGIFALAGHLLVGSLLYRSSAKRRRRPRTWLS